jgi:CheY-like chemotaxis protein
MLARRTLEAAGYEVLEVVDGQEGLDLVLASEEPIVLASAVRRLLDLQSAPR